MKYVLVPDSFKGSMTAKTVCNALQEEILSVDPTAKILSYPALDGGEGSSEYLTEIAGGYAFFIDCKDGNFRMKNTFYGIKDETAFIAVANTSGLPETEIKDPKITTTYGMGEQINDAIRRGCKTVIIALGGSSTNDGGAGAACALGAKFYHDGNSFVPTGGTLSEIDSIDLSELKKKIKGVTFIGLCDVDNPLTGENGCSYVYAKQKGAISRSEQDFLEKNMLEYAEKTSFLGVSKEEEGAGAAGGLGYFVKAFLGGKLCSGADYFLDLIGFNDLLRDTDYVICGEGKFDGTSGKGKICGKIIGRVRENHKTTTVFCGIAEENGSDDVEVYEISDRTLSLEQNMKNAEQNLRRAAQTFLRKNYKI